MLLDNEFVVPVGVDRAWAALNDPENVAPCFPGATLETVDGDTFTGSVKLRLGPISLVYKGTGTFVERDDAGHRVVVDATGRDARGGGHARVRITGTLDARGASTAVKLVTDLTITGKPAELGRGLITEVGNKIVTQFATCLAATLTTDAPVPAPLPDAPDRELDTTVVQARSTGTPVEFTDTSTGVAAAAVPEPTPAATPSPPTSPTALPDPPVAPLPPAGVAVGTRLWPAFVIVALIVMAGIWLITR